MVWKEGFDGPWARGQDRTALWRLREVERACVRRCLFLSRMDECVWKSSVCPHVRLSVSFFHQPCSSSVQVGPPSVGSPPTPGSVPSTVPWRRWQFFFFLICVSLVFVQQSPGPHASLHCSKANASRRECYADRQPDVNKVTLDSLKVGVFVVFPSQTRQSHNRVAVHYNKNKDAPFKHLSVFWKQ